MCFCHRWPLVILTGTSLGVEQASLPCTSLLGGWLWNPAPLNHPLPPRGSPTTRSQPFHTEPILPFCWPSFWGGDDRGYPPWNHNGTRSSSIYSTWPSKSMETSWAHKTSILRMNLSEILAVDTQVCTSTRHHSRASSSSISVKTGRVFHDAICRIYGQGCCLSGSPVVILGWAMLMDALMLMVTRHDLFPNHPLVFRLSLLFVNVLVVTREARSDDTSTFLILSLAYVSGPLTHPHRQSLGCPCWQVLLRQLVPPHCQHMGFPFLQHLASANHVVMGLGLLPLAVFLMVLLPPVVLWTPTVSLIPLLAWPLSWPLGFLGHFVSIPACPQPYP